MSFLTPLFLAGLGAIAIPILDPSDSARAQARRAVSVADVPAAHSVPVGPPAPDPPLVPARDARGGHRAARARLRASLLPAGRARGRGHRRRARSRHPARSVRQHGLRRSLAEGARRRAPRRRRPRAPTTGHARAVRPQRRGEHARDVRSHAARRGDQRRKGRLRRHAVRPGAEAGAEHPEPLARSSGARRC